MEAAALEAVPGGTIIRVETDSDGSAYEAHVQKADGSDVTVKVDANFNVSDTIDGFGGGPALPRRRRRPARAPEPRSLRVETEEGG